MKSPALVLAALFLPCAGAALEVREDARVDLIGAVQYLAGDRELQGPPLKALERFERFRGHAAVRRMKAMPDFRGHLPLQYAVYLSSDAAGEAFPSPEFFAAAAGGRENLAAFRAELADFAVQSGFFRWREEQPRLFAAPQEALRKTLASGDLEKPLVDLLGWRSWERWIVVPSPFGRLGASWILEEKEGLPLVYVVIPPMWKGEEPRFDKIRRLDEALWSEPIFTVAYFIMELCRPQLKALPGCGRREIDECVEPEIVKAVIARLKGKRARFGDEKQKRLAEALARYEARRDEFKDLASYRGELLAALGAPALSCPLSQPERAEEAEFARKASWYRNSRH